MYNYQDIRRVHLEISTRCNASCPDCPRNFRGVNVVDSYPLLDMKLEQAEKIFPVKFIQQLTHLLINGNYGDFVTAPDNIEIIKYFLKNNPFIKVEISTNAGARPKIWSELGKLKVKIYFRIEGLSDTHSLYRINTDFQTVMDNAQNFILAGGYAVWSMIEFDHNRHQIEQCRELSKQLGFREFELVNAGRNIMPVFDADKKFIYKIGNYTGSTNFDELFAHSSQYINDPWSTVKNEKFNRIISCFAKKRQEIYVAANGEVYPCCWLGFYPLLSNRQPSNPQLKEIVKYNNALEHGIETAIGWFNNIEQSWQKSVPEGKIFACNETCGIKE